MRGHRVRVAGRAKSARSPGPHQQCTGPGRGAAPGGGRGPLGGGRKRGWRVPQKARRPLAGVTALSTTGQLPTDPGQDPRWRANRVTVPAWKSTGSRGAGTGRAAGWALPWHVRHAGHDGVVRLCGVLPGGGRCWSLCCSRCRAGGCRWEGTLCSVRPGPGNPPHPTITSPPSARKQAQTSSALPRTATARTTTPTTGTAGPRRPGGPGRWRGRTEPGGHGCPVAGTRRPSPGPPGTAESTSRPARTNRCGPWRRAGSRSRGRWRAAGWCPSSSAAPGDLRCGRRISRYGPPYARAIGCGRASRWVRP